MAQILEACDINLAYEAYACDRCEARLEAVVMQGEPLVRHFAGLYGHGCPAEELYQSGMLGLMRAVRSYDGRVRFSTWASTCIIGEIRHFTRAECRFAEHSPGVPAEGGPPQGYEAEPRVCQVAYSENEVSGLPFEDQGFHLRLDDSIAISQALEKLGLQQRKVIDALYYRGLTQRQAAAELGLNQRKVSRLMKKALSVLAGLLEAPSFKLVSDTKSFKKLKK